jgi:hypothetical protein
MKRQVSAIVREIIAYLNRTESNDAKIEKQLEEIKKEFFTNLTNKPGLEDLNAEEIWNKIKDSIRREMRYRPKEWKN